MSDPRRFDVCLVNLDPTRVAEIRKTRLARRLGCLPEARAREVSAVLVEMFAYA